MNKGEHIEKIIGDLQSLINILCIKYNIPENTTFERCLSTYSIENMILNDEKSVYDQLDSIYKKGVKNLFNELKRNNLLGNPRLFYYKDNTIKVNSNIIDTLWFNGSKDSVYFVLQNYLLELKTYLEQLSFIKYVQYVLDIPGLKLEIGREKLILEESGITIIFPFKGEDVDFLVDLLKAKLKDKKMEIMSTVLLFRETDNDMYIPQKYEDYNIPEIFTHCLDEIYIKSIYQAKYVKVYFESEFIEVAYISAYEFINNKTNKPYCYFYIRNNKLLDKEIENKINRILRLQDSLE